MTNGTQGAFGARWPGPVRTALFSAAASLIGALPAQACQICDLGVLDNGGWSQASAISADGSVVVGQGGTPLGTRAFRWVEGGTAGDPGNPQMQNLGTIMGDESYAYGVNADGSVVVGEIYYGDAVAFRWVEGSTGGEPDNPQMHVLGWLTGGFFSQARAVNADGTVVVGYSTTNSGAFAFRWVEGGTSGEPGNPQMQNLGALYGANQSEANGVNADGTVVVGSLYSNLGHHAFRWVEGGTAGDPGNPQMQDLGSLGIGSAVATAVNAVGNVVVGHAAHPLGGSRAFRWVEGGTDGVDGNPQMQDLGTLDGGGASYAEGVNADGTVVVGVSDSSIGSHAFRWVEGGTGGAAGNPQMQSLGVLQGHNWSSATGVSADGNIVVGFSGNNSETRAFIWRGVMEDHANLIDSFPVLANDSAVAMAQHRLALLRLMGRRGLAAAGGTVFFSQVVTDFTARNPTTVGARSSVLGGIGFGRGLDERLTLGASVSLGQSRLDDNAFDMGAGANLAFWALYSDGGAARTGLQMSGALGWGTAQGEIARGRLLAGVVPATGRARITTLAAEATLGYGFVSDGWLLTPRATLSHSWTRRAAYTETGAAFNASYDEARASQTTLTLALSVERAAGPRGRISMGAGIEQVLSDQPPRLSGTSDIPGLTVFDIPAGFVSNRTRPFIEIGYTHDLGNGASIAADLRLGRAAYGNSLSAGVAVNWLWRY